MSGQEVPAGAGITAPSRMEGTMSRRRVLKGIGIGAGGCVPRIEEHDRVTRLRRRDTTTHRGRLDRSDRHSGIEQPSRHAARQAKCQQRQSDRGKSSRHGRSTRPQAVTRGLLSWFRLEGSWGQPPGRVGSWPDGWGAKRFAKWFDRARCRRKTAVAEREGRSSPDRGQRRFSAREGFRAENHRNLCRALRIQFPIA